MAGKRPLSGENTVINRGVALANAATIMIGISLKMSVVKRGVNLGSQLRLRVLVGAKKMAQTLATAVTNGKQNVVSGDRHGNTSAELRLGR